MSEIPATMWSQLDELVPGKGRIFLLPVPFTPPYPTRFVLHLDRVDSTGRELARISTENLWNDVSGRYLETDEPRNTEIGAKVRPFLVLREIFQRGVSCVLGLPITKLNAGMQNNQSLMNQLRRCSHNHYYLLDPHVCPQTHLRYPSLVVLTTPAVLPKDYFSQPLGVVAPEDWTNITCKLKNFFTFDQGGQRGS